MLVSNNEISQTASHIVYLKKLDPQMKNPIQLSIILTTHTKSNYFNDLLEKVLAFNNHRFEIIIINDSAAPAISEAIEREVQNSENERVYVFDHEKPTGRGSSLNEALVHASGSLIWAPLRADRLNESLLSETVRKFQADPVAFWILDYDLPERPSDWVQAAEEGELPDDSCLVWNREMIDPEMFYFNPFMRSLYGAELALRLKQENSWYKTDPFFVVADDQSNYAAGSEIQELLFSALRSNEDEELRKEILKELSENKTKERDKVSDHELLIQARNYLQQGEASLSLDLINKFLKRNPGHHEAVRIKITSLEKLRRYVEAAELKHLIHKEETPPSPQTPGPDEEKVQKPNEIKTEQKTDTTAPHEPESEIPEMADKDDAEVRADQADAKTVDKESVQDKQKEGIRLSVIIPTTGHGKVLLESTLVHLEQAVDSNTTELIVIDNASIDDTFDYLDQLKEHSFLNIKAITNPTNRGFASSVNQGLDIAEGEFILVLHNDVKVASNTTDQLKAALQNAENAVLSAPLLNTTHIQSQKKNKAEEKPLIYTDRADSCCFMIKSDLDLRFDEAFRLCFFEMDDFCRQIKQQGYQMVISTETLVEHQKGSTTSLMGIDLTPEVRWENRARFYNKWNQNKQFELPEQGTHPERFQRLGAPANPMDPDPEWVQTVHDYLTSEIRTEILRNDWNEDELLTIVLTLLIADERELLRTLEDRLTSLTPDKFLLVLFVHYYFKKNIFSRCKHYIAMADEPYPVFDLYRLKMMVADKEFEDAAPLLSQLLERYPSSPELYYLAGEMYKKTGEDGEAKSFFAMASQLDPFRFRPDEAAFQLKADL
jgi:glycosyltransferase involved in cell wall biosynthesis